MSRLSNRDVDELIQAQYEEALADELPWAIESYEYRRKPRKVVKSAVTPVADDGLASGEDPGRAGTTTNSGVKP